MDGFCAHLIESSFTWHSTRGHIGRVAHLNAYLNAQRVESTTLFANDVAAFLDAYPRVARHRGPLSRHMAALSHSIRRLIAYLRLEAAYQDAPQKRAAFEPLLDEYVQWLDVEHGCCAGTLEHRVRSARRFLEELGPQATQWNAWTADVVTAFFLRHAERTGPSARRQLQAGLRLLLRFCRQRGYIDAPLELAVPTLRRYRLSSVPRGFNEDQASAILGAMDPQTMVGSRDLAMCTILHAYGVRGGQVRALRLEDVDWGNDRITFRALKQGKDTVVPITQEVGHRLLEYLQRRPSSPHRRIFVTSRAPFKPLKRSSNRTTRVAAGVDRAGIGAVPRGSHAFRHGFATRMLAEGHALKAIADILGHRHLATTFIYAKVDFTQLDPVALPWPREERS
jgi:site-specific recombinase XerD